MLGDDVGLEVDRVADAAAAERRAREGLGDEADGEAVLAGLDGAQESATAYAATGQVQIDIRRSRASLVDEAI